MVIMLVLVLLALNLKPRQRQRIAGLHSCKLENTWVLCPCQRPISERAPPRTPTAIAGK